MESAPDYAKLMYWMFTGLSVVVALSYAGALGVWLFCRKKELPAELNWSADLSTDFRAIRFVVFQQEPLAILAMVALSIFDIAIINFVDPTTESVLAWISYSISTVLGFKITWALMRMIVILKAPELLHQYASFKASAFRLFMISLLVCLPVTIGWMFFVIPGVYAFLLFSMASSACTIDNRGILKSCSESADLVEKNFQLSARYILPSAMLIMLLPLAVSFADVFLSLANEAGFVPEQLAWPSYFCTVGIRFVDQILNFLSLGLFSALTTRLYLALRAKHEHPINPPAEVV
jgi:Uncharacterised protein family (UPF0259).